MKKFRIPSRLAKFIRYLNRFNLITLVIYFLYFTTPGPAGASINYQITNTAVPSTASPTVTAPAPYQPTVMSTQSLSFACPSASPVGWGTVTPGADYMSFCGQCVVSGDNSGTSTPSASRTPNPTYAYYTQAACQTVAPGGEGCSLTPGVTPSVTALPPTATGTPGVTSTPSACGGWSMSFDRVGLSNASGFTTMGSVTCSPEGENYRCTGTASQVDTHPTTDSNMVLYFDMVGTITTFNISGTVVDNYSGGASGTWTGGVTYPLFFTGGGFFGSGVYTPVQLTTSNMGGTEINIAFYGGGPATTTHNYTVNLLFARNETCATAPTPTPTVVVTPTSDPSFCSSLYNSIAPAFDWSGITKTGLKSCVDIGPSEGLSLGGIINPPIFAFPWIAHLCLEEVDLGVLTVWEVQISVTIIAYTLALAWAIRNLFIS